MNPDVTEAEADYFFQALDGGRYGYAGAWKMFKSKQVSSSPDTIQVRFERITDWTYALTPRPENIEPDPNQSGARPMRLVMGMVPAMFPDEGVLLMGSICPTSR